MRSDYDATLTLHSHQRTSYSHSIVGSRQSHKLVKKVRAKLTPVDVKVKVKREILRILLFCLFCERND